MDAIILPDDEHPFLKGLVPEHRSVVLQGAEEGTFGPGDILFREGYPANQLYLIRKGQVALETHIPHRGDIPIASVGAGQLLGWSWLVPPFVWHFQGRALEPVQATVLNGGHLLIASEQNHYLGYELMKAIGKVILNTLLTAHGRWLEIGPRPLETAGQRILAPPPDPSAPLDVRLSEHPFCHGMPPEHLNTCAALATTRVFKEGQLAFHTGDLAQGLYLVESGHLVLESPVGGTPVIVQHIEAGDAFGWSSFCEPYRWHFDGRTLQPSSTIYISAADLRERCAASYHFGYELTKRITRMVLQRLQATRNRVWEALR